MDDSVKRLFVLVLFLKGCDVFLSICNVFDFLRLGGGWSPFAEDAIGGGFSFSLPEFLWWIRLMIEFEMSLAWMLLNVRTPFSAFAICFETFIRFFCCVRFKCYISELPRRGLSAKRGLDLTPWPEHKEIGWRC